MSNQKEKIKLDFSTIRADFQLSDVITTLILLNKEPRGRYKLKEDLDLTESSVKSLLNYCKNAKLVNASIGRIGHSLDIKGKELIEEIKFYMIENDFLDYPIFNEKSNYLIIIKPVRNVLQSWKVRDVALSFGGEAVLVLTVNEKGLLQFPEEDIQLNHYFPKLQSIIETKFHITLKENMLILIIGAEKKQTARKCAFITTINIIPELNARFT